MLALAAAWLLAMPASAGPRSPLPEETNVVETERSRIAEYAKQLDETNRLVAAKQAEIARLDRETETLERLVAGAKRRIGLGGSETVGTAFLRELIRVREARALVRVAEADRTTELDLELRGLDLADRSQALGDLDAAIADCLDDAAVPAGDGRAPLADALRPLLIEQRDKHVGPSRIAPPSRRSRASRLRRRSCSRRSRTIAPSSWETSSGCASPNRAGRCGSGRARRRR
jgi:hypothetical protein